MAGDTQLGNIVIQIEMDVARMLTAQRQVEQRLGQMEVGFNRTGRAVDATERSMFSLSRVATALSAALSIQQVTQYANAWVDVNNKLANSVKASEDLATVTSRVFDISQETRSSLSATATLYGRLERATKAAGVSTADLSRLTTTINKGLVVSGATAEEASSTMIQLSQALASGVLRGEEFNSISENGSRLAVALADSLGVTIGELRAMAAQGKLTTDVVVKGLLGQSDTIAKEFGNTMQTMGQAFTVAENNITKFIGSSTTIQSGISAFNSAIVSMSENIDGIGQIIAGVATVMGSRYVGALTLATSEKLKSIVTTRRLVIAENESSAAAALSASSALRAAEAAKLRAIDEVRVAQALRNSALSVTAAVAAETRLSAARVAATTATDNYNRALAANASAQATAGAAARSASLGAGLLRGGLSLIGGPAGAAMLAGAAVFYFYQKAQQAKQESMDFADKLDGLIGKMRSMSKAQVDAEIVNTTKAIRGQSEALEEQEAKVAALTKRVNDYQVSMKIYGESERSVRNLRDTQEELTLETAKLEEMERKNSRTKSALNLLQAQANGVRREGIDLLRRDSEQIGIAADMMTSLGNAINFASRAKEGFNSTSLKVERSADGDKLLGMIQQENELLAITDKRQRAVAAARQKALSAGVAENSNQLRQIEEAAAANYDLEQAEAKRGSTTKAIAKTTDEAVRALQRQREALDRLSMGFAEGSLELAKYDAVKALGKNATQAQIEQAEKYAEAQFKATQAVKNLAEAEQGRKFASQEIAANKVLPDPISGTAVDPVAQIDLQEQQKLDALAKYRELDKQNLQTYEDAKTAIQQQAAKARQQVVRDENQRQVDNMNMLLGGVSAGFDGLANIVAKAAGDNSSAYKVLFAVSKGFAVAQSALNLQLAISNAMASGPFPWNLANMASVAAAGGGLISAIGGISYSGARYNGGPVSANSMYRVGEKGKPEIYQASNGNQFMIPGDNGRVISNKDMQGAGGGNGTVIQQTNYFTIQSSTGDPQELAKQIADISYQQSLRAIKEQSTRPRGMIQPRK